MLANDASSASRLDAHSSCDWAELRYFGSRVYSWPLYCTEPWLSSTREVSHVWSTHSPPEHSMLSQQENMALFMEMLMEVTLTSTCFAGLNGSIVYRSEPSSSVKVWVKCNSPRLASYVEYSTVPRAKSCSTNSYRGPQCMNTFVSLIPPLPPSTWRASNGIPRVTPERSNELSPPSSSSTAVATPKSSRSNRPKMRIPISVHLPVPRNSRLVL
mmetsp:Transcript_24295/g.46110  ORF Transcript_24295/g.46110 Transcript_24295/m.46110 type:complete len:214 (-) Transcript_24295:534-1175(-)